MFQTFIQIYLKFFFLLTPFFLLSTFLSLTRDMDYEKRRKTAFKVMLSVFIISVILLFIGNQIFSVFGITLNSFRIGTGALLFLSAKSLVQGKDAVEVEDEERDIAVVPLAMPVAGGPATTGALLVIGTELPGAMDKIAGISAIVMAILTTGLFLYLSAHLEKLVKREGLHILSKITGLILAALAAEMIMTGVKGFLG
jgi:multiple antibiotic resistance protein